MGVCQSSEQDETQQSPEVTNRSRDIDRLLLEHRRKMCREYKILLLGSENSGKSTIVKQMKIIHQNGYTVDELNSYRQTIYTNVIDCAQTLIQALRDLEVEVENPQNRRNCDLIMEHSAEPDPLAPLGDHIGKAIFAVWCDPCIPRVLDRSSEFYLMDSAPYFFDEMQRISSSKYIPTEADVLRARTRTTGISETRFQTGDISIHMFDVGGQRSERKKWIHCFENVGSIIFCVALNEYDQLLLEDSYANRLMESLVLFDSIVNSRWFTRSSIILFLNKVDLFQAKLNRSPLSNHFPDYTGGSDVNQATEYIRGRFIDRYRGDQDVYSQ
jgi:guanine nucleotide-binding protein subunit alpha